MGSEGGYPQHGADWVVFLDRRRAGGVTIRWKRGDPVAYVLSGQRVGDHGMSEVLDTVPVLPGVGLILRRSVSSTRNGCGPEVPKRACLVDLAKAAQPATARRAAATKHDRDQWKKLRDRSYPAGLKAGGSQGLIVMSWRWTSSLCWSHLVAVSR
jgi:hypothetical protein